MPPIKGSGIKNQAAQDLELFEQHLQNQGLVCLIQDVALKRFLLEYQLHMQSKLKLKQVTNAATCMKPTHSNWSKGSYKDSLVFSDSLKKVSTDTRNA